MFSGNDKKSDGIFVLDGQIYSANDLINAMRRHGIRLQITRNGIAIEGEQISSISNLEDNKCPLAGTCEKRVALVEFLKLQRQQSFSQRTTPQDDLYEDDFDNFDRSSEFTSYPQNRDDTPTSRRDNSRTNRDFIKPNNHDLFEGNVRQSNGLFDDQPVDDARTLFDEPEFRSTPDKSFFEDSFYDDDNDDYDSDMDYSRDKPSYSSSKNFDFSRQQQRSHQDQSYCRRCGSDVDPNWVVCPKCRAEIKPRAQVSDEDYLFK
ncbi:MAG: hypothetical protein FK734_14765 [Asgard group archaeon]|nr:hypothetical protein [Asgard group archaeon]